MLEGRKKSRRGEPVGEAFDYGDLWGNLSFPDRSVDKESAYNAGDPGSIPGLGRSPGEGNSYPLQYSGLQNSIDYIVHGWGTIVQG